MVPKSLKFLQTLHWASFILASGSHITSLLPLTRWNCGTCFSMAPFGTCAPGCWHLGPKNGDRETLERQSYANLQTDLEGKRNCSFQCWLICMKINLAQTLCSLIQHPRKEEKSQLQQSNTSRGANRSNEWDQKIEKGVADAQIKHVLKKRSGICLSCRSKTYHLKWLQKHLFVIDTAENCVKFDDILRLSSGAKSGRFISPPPHQNNLNPRQATGKFQPFLTSTEQTVPWNG